MATTPTIKALGLLLFSIIMASLSIFNTFGEVDIEKTLWMWFYGLVFVVIIGLGAMQKSSVVQGAFLAGSLAYIWWLIDIHHNTMFTNSLFLYTILVVLATSFVFREEIEATRTGAGK